MIRVDIKLYTGGSKVSSTYLSFQSLALLIPTALPRGRHILRSFRSATISVFSSAHESLPSGRKCCHSLDVVFRNEERVYLASKKGGINSHLWIQRGIETATIKEIDSAIPALVKDLE